MKNELRIVLLSFLFMLGISYLFFNFNANLTGFAILEESVASKEMIGISAIEIFEKVLEFGLNCWEYILIIIAIFAVVGFIVYKKFRIKVLKKKIRKMKTERKVLIHLMKIAQIRRFKQNKISGLVYEIRMKKYQEKLERIKQEFPVVQARLEKYLKKKRKVKINKKISKGGKK